MPIVVSEIGRSEREFSKLDLRSPQVSILGAQPCFQLTA